MNKYFLAVNGVVLGCFFVTVPLGLNYLEATVLFGLVAAGLAPIAIHKVPKVYWATGLLVGLTFFASFPFKKLFQLDGPMQELAVSIVYGGLLWVIGAGWKRSWKFEG